MKDAVTHSMFKLLVIRGELLWDGKNWKCHWAVTFILPEEKRIFLLNQGQGQIHFTKWEPKVLCNSAAIRMEQMGLVLYLSKFTELWVNIYKVQDNMLTLEQIRKNPLSNAYFEIASLAEPGYLLNCYLCVF